MIQEPASGARLPEQRGERIDRDTEVTFTFDGRAVRGLEGDTIGSAIFAAGQRTFSRSFKYHRRRGLLCCAGQCPNCLVSVDGAPGVRACTEPVRNGMQVEHMNASPSLEFDAMRATDIFGGPFTPPGFYYKTFIRPRRLWPLYEKVLRHAAGLGKLRKSQPEREWRTEYRRRHADVLVIGGGAAGLSAAAAAAELGADVVLCDEGPEPGGRLLAEGAVQYAQELAERTRTAGVEILATAPALGTFDGLVPVWQGDTLHQIRARRQVYATGAIEQPLLFPGNDLPGVMLSGGARRLIGMYAVKPGMRAIGCDGRRPRAPRRARADRRGRGGLLRGRPARARERRARRGARADERRPDARLDGARGPRAQPPRGRRARAAGRGQGPDRRLRPARGVGRDRARHLARRAGGREDGVRRVARPLRSVARAGGRAGRRRAHRAQRARRGGALGRGGRCRCCARARVRRQRLALPRRCRARAAAAGGVGVAGGRAAAGDERAQGQVLRLPLRGRHREGHPPVRRGGLRLDRAVEALHDRHDGPLPGPHVPAARRAADGEGNGDQPRRRGHHDRAAAVARGADGRAGRPPVRARQAELDPRAPPRARRERAVGGRLAPRLRLWRPDGRGDGGAQGGGPDRRLDARQADRARAGRGRVPRSPLPEPLLQPEARAASATA